MQFSRNVQLAVTWRIIADIVLFHGSELGIAIEQNYGDTGRYSLALTQGTLGLPYLNFAIGAQKVEVEVPASDFDELRPENAQLPADLAWDPENYVAAFLTRDPYSVVLDIEALAAFTRQEYEACWVTRYTLPIVLIAGLLQRKMFTDRALEVSNAFCHSRDDEKCRVREWARADPKIPEWVFDPEDEEWVEKAKESLYLWKLCPAEDFNANDSHEAPGIVFNLDQCTVTFQGNYQDTISLWDLHQGGAGYDALLDTLENNLKGWEAKERQSTRS